MFQSAILFSLFIFFFYSDDNTTNYAKTSFVPVINKNLSDTTGWITNFKTFRDALYQGNKAKVKSFINFPVMSTGNEIWYLVYGSNDKMIDKLGDKKKPFTGEDFDTYFTKLFSKQFILCMQKINTDKLFKTGEFETPEISNGKATVYKIFATVNKADESLVLNFASNTTTKDTNGEVLDGGEFNVIYYFKILPTGQLKFIEVKLAG